jgi:hypothetical protein
MQDTKTESQKGQKGPPQTDVAIRNRFRALAEPARTAEVVAKTFGARGISLFDLERIRLPTGWGALWQIVGADGEASGERAIEAIIPWMRNDRLYWGREFGSGVQTPPCCTSLDLISQGVEYGHGDNGSEDGKTSHACSSCTQNRFGTGEKGRGKACREIWTVFLLRAGREDGVFPAVLFVTPGSLKPWRKYHTWLCSRGLYYASVLHRLELQQAKSSDGIAYSAIKPSVVRELTDEETAVVESYGQIVRESFGGVMADSADIGGALENRLQAEGISSIEDRETM